MISFAPVGVKRDMPRLDDVVLDVRAALRSVATFPVACAVAVVSLGGGIGATTATLIVRDVVFHRPPALYRQPEQLSRVQVGSPDHPIVPLGSPVPSALFAAWRDTIRDAAFAASTPARVHDVRTADRTEAMRIRAVTPDLFAVLGVDAAVGRTLPPRRDGTPQVVLSHRAWQTLFDARPDAIGATVWIENRPHTVAGVMPERFWFSSMDSPLWTPLDARAAAADPGLEVVARRRDGVTPAMLERELRAGLAAYAAAQPAGHRDLRLKVSGIEGTPLGQQVSIALPWLLAACVALTLVIACANVAILVIAQWTAREREIAIRAAIGASRWRIVRLLLTESLLIASAGGALGVLATVAIRGAIVRDAGDNIRFFDLSIDPRVFLEAAAITALTGLAAGLGPALVETRRLHGNPMHTMASSDRVRQTWRHTLVVMEIAVTIALLVVTSGMLDLYRRSFSTDLGYATDRLLMVRVENGGGVPVARVLEVIRQAPNVAAAAASTSVPFLAAGPLQRVAADAAESNAVQAEQVAIGAGFFETLGVPLRAGRGFDASDLGARTAIVNEALALRLARRGPAERRARSGQAGSPRDAVVGASIWMNGIPYSVVDVVADYSNTQLQNPERAPKVFLPLDAGATRPHAEFLVRAATDPAPVLRALRTEIGQAAAGTVVASGFTMPQLMDVAAQEILIGTAPLAPLVATGMLLTSVGIYGVLAFAVARRSRELAVRVAMGASGRDLLRLVIAHSFRLVAIGIGCGVGCTFALSRVVRASGAGGSMLDPPWEGFVVPALVVLAIGAIATWIPSRRAMNVDPAVLLRTT